MHVLEVRSAELMESLTEQAKALAITDAAIVTLISAADSFIVSTMPQEDPSVDVLTDSPAEMTATGEMVDGAVHVHAAVMRRRESLRHAGPTPPPRRRIFRHRRRGDTTVRVSRVDHSSRASDTPVYRDISG
ncbi:MAG TPA: hypothetical protein VGD71_27690 [Kribbella sp.]